MTRHRPTVTLSNTLQRGEGTVTGLRECRGQFFGRPQPRPVCRQIAGGLRPGIFPNDQGAAGSVSVTQTRGVQPPVPPVPHRAARGLQPAPQGHSSSREVSGSLADGQPPCSGQRPPALGRAGSFQALSVASFKKILAVTFSSPFTTNPNRVVTPFLLYSARD